MVKLKNLKLISSKSFFIFLLVDLVLDEDVEDLRLLVLVLDLLVGFLLGDLDLLVGFLLGDLDLSGSSFVGAS